MDTKTSADLANYLIERARRRTEEADALLAELSPRERHVIREAAVMGFFQGHRLHGVFDPNTDWPADSVVLAHVMDGVLANRDLYPTISGHQRETGDG